jgi:hypothetical protein
MGDTKMKESTALKCAVTTCNISYFRKIDGQTLASILRGEHPVAPWLSHVATFFNEATEKHIRGVSEECHIPMEHLAQIFYSLPDAYQENNFSNILYERPVENSF